MLGQVAARKFGPFGPVGHWPASSAHVGLPQDGMPGVAHGSNRSRRRKAAEPADHSGDSHHASLRSKSRLSLPQRLTLCAGVLRLGRQKLWFWVASAVLAGCATAPQHTSSVRAGLGGTAAEAEAVFGQGGPELVTVRVPEPLPIAPAAPLPAAGGTAAASSRPNDWVNLEAWSLDNGYGRPVQSQSVAGPIFLLRAQQAAIELRLGSVWAWCNGSMWSLGFAPRLINGLPHVHLLDVLKNLRPLLDRSGGPPVARRSILIDPGHGGRDSGTHNSVTGAWEKDLTLDWAMRLARLLLARGWQVYMTRTNDVALSPAERVALAENSQAALFLSLHFNAVAGNRTLAGIETYCLTPAGLPSSLVRDEPDDPGQVYPNNAFDEANLQVAFELHRALVQRTGAPDRGLRRARCLGVLRWQNRPAVLVEGGYLSNPTEARRIASPDYRQAMAQALADALERLAAGTPTASVGQPEQPASGAFQP